LKCSFCGAEIPNESKFCLSCGRAVDILAVEPIRPPDGSDTDTTAIVLLAFAAMLLFFGIGMAITIFLWPVAVILFAVGSALLVARHFVLSSYAKRVEKHRQELAAKVKCVYCGTMNERSDEKCVSCGAGLWNRS